MKTAFVLYVSLFAFTSVAAPLTGGCVLNVKGKKMHFNGKLNELTNTSSGRGTFYVDNRPTADFEGDDLKVSLLFQSFRLRNNRGDVIEGKVTDFGKRLGVVKRLSIPSHRLELQNVPISCWYR